MSYKFSDDEPAKPKATNWTHVSIVDLMLFSFKATVAAIPVAASIAGIWWIASYVATH